VNPSASSLGKADTEAHVCESNDTPTEETAATRPIIPNAKPRTTRIRINTKKAAAAAAAAAAVTVGVSSKNPAPKTNQENPAKKHPRKSAANEMKITTASASSGSTQKGGRTKRPNVTKSVTTKPKKKTRRRQLKKTPGGEEGDSDDGPVESSGVRWNG
jgi:negative regulator of sigma E activity